MKKIWIIHNTTHGNSEKIAKSIAEALKGEYDVSIDDIKKIKPNDIAKDEPYGLIIAVRIIAFSSDKKMRKFIEKLDKEITKPIAKVTYFSTHATKWKQRFIKGMKSTIAKIGCVEEVCPEFLEVCLEGAKGPIPEDANSKIEDYITAVKDFLS